jgi:hypothetical protein
MIWLTDAVTKNQIAINPKYVVAVFRAPEDAPEGAGGKTVISLTNGTVIVDDSELDVVSRVNAGDI